MRAGDFRVGSIFKMDDGIYRVVEFAKIQQPRMVAFVRAKIKNIENGAVREERFNTGDIFTDIDITRKEMQFSYQDGNLYHFMDLETCDIIPVNADMVEDCMKFVNEDNDVMFTFEYADNKIINISPPTFVILKVIECPPSVAGDTARNALKSAKLESGLEIKVPMFVNNGDRIKVDTRTATYAERA